MMQILKLKHPMNTVRLFTKVSNGEYKGIDNNTQGIEEIEALTNPKRKDSEKEKELYGYVLLMNKPPQ